MACTMITLTDGSTPVCSTHAAAQARDTAVARLRSISVDNGHPEGRRERQIRKRGAVWLTLEREQIPSRILRVEDVDHAQVRRDRRAAHMAIVRRTHIEAVVPGEP